MIFLLIKTPKIWFVPFCHLYWVDANGEFGVYFVSHMMDHMLRSACLSTSLIDWSYSISVHRMAVILRITISLDSLVSSIEKCSRTCNYA